MYVCLMRAGHALSSRKPSLRRFAATRHVRVNAPSRIQETVDACLAQHGLAREVSLELPSYLMLPPLLEAGDYVAIVPGQLAEAFAGRGRLAHAAVPLPLPAITIRQALAPSRPR
jgi:DNA-binding transcriptional LysR family regulator